MFTAAFTKAGGVIAETIKVPLANPDFAPFLQRAKDSQPDTLFVFVPAPQAAARARTSQHASAINCRHLALSQF